MKSQTLQRSPCETDLRQLVFKDFFSAFIIQGHYTSEACAQKETAELAKEATEKYFEVLDEWRKSEKTGCC